MLWMTRRIVRDFGTYERQVQIALLSGAFLLLLGLLAALLAPPDARLPILLGMGALVFVLELTVLWANRTQVSAFTAAQRRYLAEDFAGAAARLETERAAGKADAKMLTLLGNTYRQMAEVERSRAVLYESVDKAPADPFPRYGLGRTLLVAGEFAAAREALEKALALGAPAVAWLDVAEAALYMGGVEHARRAWAQAVFSPDDAPRAWMKWALCIALGEPRTQAEPPADADGVRYWQAMEARFRPSLYSDHLARLLDVVQAAEPGQ